MVSWFRKHIENPISGVGNQISRTGRQVAAVAGKPILGAVEGFLTGGPAGAVVGGLEGIEANRKAGGWGKLGGEVGLSGLAAGGITKAAGLGQGGLGGDLYSYLGNVLKGPDSALQSTSGDQIGKAEQEAEKTAENAAGKAAGGKDILSGLGSQILGSGADTLTKIKPYKQEQKIEGMQESERLGQLASEEQSAEQAGARNQAILVGQLAGRGIAGAPAANQIATEQAQATQRQLNDLANQMSYTRDIASANRKLQRMGLQNDWLREGATLGSNILGKTGAVLSGPT